VRAWHFTCRKFRVLVSELEDRAPDAAEEEFLTDHRRVCPECARAELHSNLALNMLRESTLEPDLHPSFDDRVVRLLQVSRARESARYWSPALAGAAIAGLTLLAVMQLMTRPMDEPSSLMPHGTAQRTVEPRSPSLILDDLP
jgi:hypothetical protein